MDAAALAWHLAVSTLTLRGRRGTYGTGLALVARLVPRRGRRDTPSFTHHFVTHHLSHTIFDTPSFTHNFVTHHLSHTIFHTPLCHTPSLTHHLSHTTLSRTIFHHTSFHTQLCHTPSFTHNFVTHTHHLSLSHTIFHIRLCPPHNSFYFSILHHQLCRSILPRPATTFVAPYWKKLTCGVIRSFNFHHSLPALQGLCSIG